MPETICHAIFHCSIVAPIWGASQFAHYLADALNGSFMELFVWIKSQLEVADFLTFMAMAWAAWSYRNSVTHDEPWSNREVGVIGILKLVNDYKLYADAVNHHRVMADAAALSRSRWSPPRDGCWQVNTDAAVLGGEGTGLGVVIRDAQGKVVLVVVRRLQARLSAPLAEAVAAKFGVQMAKNCGYDHVELETDALSLSKAILSEKIGCSPLDLLVGDIRVVGCSFISFDVFHVKRCGNTVAHLVARILHAEGREQVFVDDFPQGVLALADLDVA